MPQPKKKIPWTAPELEGGVVTIGGDPSIPCDYCDHPPAGSKKVGDESTSTSHSVTGWTRPGWLAWLREGPHLRWEERKYFEKLRKHKMAGRPKPYAYSRPMRYRVLDWKPERNRVTLDIGWYFGGVPKKWKPWLWVDSLTSWIRQKHEKKIEYERQNWWRPQPGDYASPAGVMWLDLAHGDTRARGSLSCDHGEAAGDAFQPEARSEGCSGGPMPGNGDLRFATKHEKSKAEKRCKEVCGSKKT